MDANSNQAAEPQGSKFGFIRVDSRWALPAMNTVVETFPVLGNTTPGVGKKRWRQTAMPNYLKL